MFSFSLMHGLMRLNFIFSPKMKNTFIENSEKPRFSPVFIKKA